MLGKYTFGFIFASVTLIGHAQDVSKYVEVRAGTLPLILTVPHGGDLKPQSILARRYGVTAKDSNTAEISLMIIEEVQKLYGGSPHAVICRMHRSKVDCNRELEEAAQGDPLAMATWKHFHDSAEEMEMQVIQKFGCGLTLDIHGHRHEIPRVELGYLIPGAQLNATNEQLEQDPKSRLMSSVRDLDKRSPQTFVELIRGPQSLGALLEKQGFQSIPTPSTLSPGKAIYFSGSYDITAHGSRDEGSISAIQVECPWIGVRDTKENQRRFAKALAAVLGPYFELHFQMHLTTSKK